MTYESHDISHGVSILNFELRYMWYLYDHLQPGSFKPIYADTDSMCLALSRSRFGNTDDLEDLHRGLYEPIVKEEMRESWNKSFKDWFVTTRDARDEKKPGKWKSKL